MSGNYTGLQTRIKSKSPNADYIHCASHNLNLVLNDSVESIKEISVFYDVVNKVYVFFTQSLPRFQLFRTEQNDECNVRLTLKKLCPTRWSSRYDALLSLKENFTIVMKCLTKIILMSSKNNEVVEATGLRKNMSTFNFVLMLVFQSKILERVQITSKCLQRVEISLDDASGLLKKSLDSISAMREDFAEIVQQAQTLAATWTIEPSMPVHRQRRVKTFFDELSSDSNFKDPLISFKVNVFLKSVDIVIAQLSQRFHSMFTITETFNFLKPDKLVNFTDQELVAASTLFYEKYKTDVNYSLVNELLCFRNLIKEDIKNKNISKIRDLAHYLLIENKMIACSVPNVCTAFLMFLTLPVTVATSERSFSKLKIIKNYLRNSMSQTRLSGLSVLSIEHEKASRLNLDEITKKFVEAKSRRGWT